MSKCKLKDDRYEIIKADGDFVGLRVLKETDFFDVIRDVIAGRIKASCVYYMDSTLESTWYAGNLDYDIWFQDRGHWDQAFECLPEWVAKG